MGTIYVGDYKLTDSDKKFIKIIDEANEASNKVKA